MLSYRCLLLQECNNCIHRVTRFYIIFGTLCSVLHCLASPSLLLNMNVRTPPRPVDSSNESDLHSSSAVCLPSKRNMRETPVNSGTISTRRTRTSSSKTAAGSFRSSQSCCPQGEAPTGLTTATLSLIVLLGGRKRRVRTARELQQSSPTRWKFSWGNRKCCPATGKGLGRDRTVISPESWHLSGS